MVMNGRLERNCLSSELRRAIYLLSIKYISGAKGFTTDKYKQSISLSQGTEFYFKIEFKICYYVHHINTKKGAPDGDH